MIQETSPRLGAFRVLPEDPVRLAARCRPLLERTELAAGRPLMRSLCAPAVISWAGAVMRLPAEPREVHPAAVGLFELGLERAAAMIEFAARSPLPTGLNTAEREELPTARRSAAFLAGLASAAALRARLLVRSGPRTLAPGEFLTMFFARTDAPVLAQWRPAADPAKESAAMLKNLLPGRALGVLADVPTGFGRTGESSATFLDAVEDLLAGRTPKDAEGELLAAALDRAVRREEAQRRRSARALGLAGLPPRAGLMRRIFMDALTAGLIRVVDRRTDMKRFEDAGAPKSAGSAPRPRLWVTADGAHLEWPKAARILSDAMAGEFEAVAPAQELYDSDFPGDPEFPEALLDAFAADGMLEAGHPRFAVPVDLPDGPTSVVRLRPGVELEAALTFALNAIDPPHAAPGEPAPGPRAPQPLSWVMVRPGEAGCGFTENLTARKEPGSFIAQTESPASRFEWRLSLPDGTPKAACAVLASVEKALAREENPEGFAVKTGLFIPERLLGEERAELLGSLLLDSDLFEPAPAALIPTILRRAAPCGDLPEGVDQRTTNDSGALTTGVVVRREWAEAGIRWGDGRFEPRPHPKAGWRMCDLPGGGAL